MFDPRKGVGAVREPPPLLILPTCRYQPQLMIMSPCGEFSRSDYLLQAGNRRSEAAHCSLLYRFVKTQLLP